MNYAELLQAARGQMGPCRACPVCNGVGIGRASWRERGEVSVVAA